MQTTQNRMIGHNVAMNGAESLVSTLAASGIEVCFANPGTSEMHFVGALDRIPGIRCVLTLFEGVATGAADGYARMLDKPAITLLHLGPGLANGFANLHNAKKAASPIVNIVGDHATYHRKYDAPLTSDIETAAQPFSHWVRTSPDARSIAADGAAAVAAARVYPGQIATLILPADTAWNASNGPAAPVAVPPVPQTSQEAIRDAMKALQSGEPTMILLDGHALRARGLELAGRIAARTGAKVFAGYHNTRVERGAGRYVCDRVPYVVDQALPVLQSFKHYILVGARMPVAFFAYPNKPSLLHRTDAVPHVLATAEQDGVAALEWLAEECGAAPLGATNPLAPPAPAQGKITSDALGISLAALLPEQAIVVDESASVGRTFFGLAKNSAPHDWLNLKGGAIGYGTPAATGAAIACPDRPVVCLESDGSGLYTLQSLWTHARESLNVTTVVLANRSYATLVKEFANVGAVSASGKALDMFDLGRPVIDWVKLAQGFGVPGERVETMEDFNRAFAGSVASPGPYLIEVVI
jgi:acetolactate synthase-1/2/3 large subunit